MNRFPDKALLVTFPVKVVLGHYQCPNEGRIVSEGIVHRLGAFDNEGAFSFSNPLVTEDVANARGLRAR